MSRLLERKCTELFLNLILGLAATLTVSITLVLKAPAEQTAQVTLGTVAVTNAVYLIFLLFCIKVYGRISLPFSH